MQLKEISPRERANSCGLCWLIADSRVRNVGLNCGDDLHRRLAQTVFREIVIHLSNGRQTHVVPRTRREFAAAEIETIDLILLDHVVERHEAKVPVHRTDVIHDRWAIPRSATGMTLVPDKSANANVLFLDRCNSVTGGKRHLILLRLNSLNEIVH